MPRRGKEIAFLVLAVLALVVAVMTFRGKPGRSVAPTAKPAGGKATQPSGAPEKAREVAQAKEGSVKSAGPATRNPFTAPGGTPETALAPPPSGPAEEASAESTGRPAARPGGGVTILQGPAPGPARPGGPAPGEPGAPKLTLTGVIAGQPSMAVIREDDQRHFVRVGDRIGDRYRVSAIGRQEVVLVGGGGKLVLRLRGGG